MNEGLIAVVAVVVSAVAIAGQFLCGYVVLKVKSEVLPVLAKVRAQLDAHEKALGERRDAEIEQWKAINEHGERLSTLEAKLNGRSQIKGEQK